MECTMWGTAYPFMQEHECRELKALQKGEKKREKAEEKGGSIIVEHVQTSED